MSILSVDVCFLGYLLLRGFVARYTMAAFAFDAGCIVFDTGSLDCASLVPHLYKPSCDRCCAGKQEKSPGRPAGESVI